MSRLAVLHFPDPRLRRKARPVERVDGEIRQLAQNMLETMYAENGIGLAAIQVNVQKRVIVIDLSEERDAPMVLVNPELTDADGNVETMEGCLSVPDFADVVRRPERISYRYVSLDGETKEAAAAGLLAVCIQHEIDHLDGKLFIDYLSPLKRQRLSKKIKKREKIRPL